MVVLRGEIWWASLPMPRASEPGYRRPVLIIQVNEFNRSRIRTIIAVALTTNLRLAEAPGNVQLPRTATGLPHESVVNVSQVITLDKSFLTERVLKLSPKYLKRVEAGMRLVLGL